MKLRVVFAGTPSFAVPALEAVYRHHHLLWVYTQPDAKTGRGQKLQASPVKLWAIDNNIAYEQPERIGKEQAKMLQEQKADVLVVAAYGQIIPISVLAAPRWGCINIHASLLPRWRGAAPIQYALLHGDDQVGVSIMQMERGLDTGPVLHQVSWPAHKDMNALTLTDQMAEAGASALNLVLTDVKSFLQKKSIQDDALATLAPKITKIQAQIDWQKTSTQTLCHIRAFFPWPTAFTFYNGERIKVLAASAVELDSHSEKPGTIVSWSAHGVCVACLDGCIRIRVLQFPGKKPCDLASDTHSLQNKLLINSRFLPSF
ncbi:MAG: methionyl-tRNA formyltransferase [Pseudomonadota bacterium]|nr:methionyl-tRNA formyltransferase [Pseudomonadota bacterium]